MDLELKKPVFWLTPQPASTSAALGDGLLTAYETTLTTKPYLNSDRGDKTAAGQVHNFVGTIFRQNWPPKFSQISVAP